MTTNSLISSKAVIGSNAIIGAGTLIEDDVIIGDNVKIGNNAVIANGSRIGNGVKISHGAVISTEPQDLKFGGEITTVEIGENTTIREFATINRGTNHSKKTVVGKNCYIMSYVHIAHDCVIGDNVIIANATNMGGHVEIDNYANIGGLVAIHQFVKVGKYSFVGAGVKAVKDVPPYILAGGYPLSYEGLNKVGLKRKGFTQEQIDEIKNVYDLIYNSGLNVSQAVDEIKLKDNLTPEIQEILKFISKADRGIIPYRR
ncbi:MAG TPA: acyl-[acyl-carrier-protein]--UDP-N-acetylglucosamine O-acyltransferase [Bacteroidetes bacterium]|nr:acyl-[acyl-carrier-protein]--UDP-N-acetylglucosamine O-acyltransferase [Bacteroidota bacterium]HCN37821.1 acyl-[acyl-carrier-protein]--UDP-N-acetylglucosamine O-acyltransferase [Bacteroidota bacterium]